jgi:hypothetical protein
MKTPASKKSKQTLHPFDDTDNDSVSQHYQHLSDNPTLAETKEQECADFNDVSEERAHKKSTCWGCIHLFGKQPIYGQSPKLDLLWETYIENRDTMSDVQLAALISDAHMKIFVIPKIESSTGGELQESDLWLPNKILAHLHFHQIDIKLDIRRAMHDNAIIEASLKDAIYIKGSNGKKIHDHQVIASYLKVSSHKLQLISAYKNL